MPAVRRAAAFGRGSFAVSWPCGRAAGGGERAHVVRRPSAQSAEAAADPLRVEGLAAIICAMATSSTDIMSIIPLWPRSTS